MKKHYPKHGPYIGEYYSHRYGTLWTMCGLLVDRDDDEALAFFWFEVTCKNCLKHKPQDAAE